MLHRRFKSFTDRSTCSNKIFTIAVLKCAFMLIFFDQPITNLIYTHLIKYINRIVFVNLKQQQQILDLISIKTKQNEYISKEKEICLF